ncbi:MAG TPA: hypothetical protein VF638_13005 [Sphingomonas sp.]|jgi:hypothetical protein
MTTNESQERAGQQDAEAGVEFGRRCSAINFKDRDPERYAELKRAYRRGWERQRGMTPARGGRA